MTARLIDFHTNCSCGRDIAAALAVVDDAMLGPMLALLVQSTGSSIEQRVPVQTALNALEPAEAEPGGQAPAKAKRGRPPASQPAAAPAEG